MCQGWIATVGVLMIGLAGWLVIALVRALDEAESQLQTARDAQAQLRVERKQLFQQVNHLQEARLDRELARLGEGDGAG